MSKLQPKGLGKSPADASLALAPFCQDGAQMSGGILSLPRPGLRFGAGARKNRDLAGRADNATRNFDAARHQA